MASHKHLLDVAKGVLNGMNVADLPSFRRLADFGGNASYRLFGDKTVSIESRKLGVLGDWILPRAPRREDTVILYLHGGAYIMGSPKSHRLLTSNLSHFTKLPLFAPDYSLGPESHHPAAINDSTEAFYALGKKYRNVVVIGDSAGGGLAFSLAIRLRIKDEGVPSGIIGLSPWLDLTGKYSRKQVDPWLPLERLPEVSAMYTDNPSDPEVSPFWTPDSEFQNMPPSMIHCGSEEALLSECKLFDQRVRESLGTCELRVWEGMVHGFWLMPPYVKTLADEVAIFIDSLD